MRRSGMILSLALARVHSVHNFCAAHDAVTYCRTHHHPVDGRGGGDLRTKKGAHGDRDN